MAYIRGSCSTPHKKTDEQKEGAPQTREMHVAVLLMGEGRRTPLALIVLWVQGTCEVSLAGKLATATKKKKVNAAQCKV